MSFRQLKLFGDSTPALPTPVDSSALLGRKLLQLEVGAAFYRTIYADPPWGYRDSTCRGAASRHYPTMALEELFCLGVGNLACPQGAHLWLWATWPKMRDGWPQQVLQSWGFEWQGQIVWDKGLMGLGRYLRGQTEVLCLGVKAKLPLLASDQTDIVRVQRTRLHSEKPEEFRRIIERVSPGPRIELFARRAVPGWDRWGLEAPVTEAAPR